MFIQLSIFCRPTSLWTHLLLMSHAGREWTSVRMTLWRSLGPRGSTVVACGADLSAWCSCARTKSWWPSTRKADSGLRICENVPRSECLIYMALNIEVQYSTWLFFIIFFQGQGRKKRGQCRTRHNNRGLFYDSFIMIVSFFFFSQLEEDNLWRETFRTFVDIKANGLGSTHPHANNDIVRK